MFFLMKAQTYISLHVTRKPIFIFNNFAHVRLYIGICAGKPYC